MNCPVCNVQLTMSERQGVEIDYCPKCRGVWLDRGELDKIIERSETTGLESSERDRYDEHNRRHDEQHRHSDEQHRHSDDHNRHSDQRSYYPQQQPYKKHKKKESFLSNLFDFD